MDFFLLFCLLGLITICCTILVARGHRISLSETIFSKIALKRSLFAVFSILALYIGFILLADSGQVVRTVAKALFPVAYDPVARFASQINWEKKEVSLDASMSKVYKDKVKKYIWRIDDGTAQVGTGKLVHKFQYPGFYTIKLSIVDSVEKSDEAVCLINFPPKEVKKISVSQ